MDRRDFRLIDAHNTPVAALTLSLSGARLATASEKGTLVRVFDTSSGAKLQELRRGTDPAEIYHLAFNRSCEWLAVTSDKNTVHVFSLREPGAEGAAGAAAVRPLPRDSPTANGSASPNGDARTNPGSWLNIAQVCSVMRRAGISNFRAWLFHGVLDHCFHILVLLHILTGCEGEKVQARVSRYRALHWHCFCTYVQWRQPLKPQMQLEVNCILACETCPWY